jgi:hypothetical protein
MTGEEPAVLSGLAPLIGHAHLSRAALKPLGDQPPASQWHAVAQAALEAMYHGGYTGYISLEMLGTDDAGSNMKQLHLALETGRNAHGCDHYRRWILRVLLGLVFTA